MTLDIELVRKVALKYALLNAIEHGGKAATGPVVNKVLGELPHLRKVAREIVKVVQEIVQEVNLMSIDKQKRLLEEKFPEVLKSRERPSEEKKLPPLPNVNKWGRVVTRFAPNPDFVLHLGSARPAILSYEYARLYNGKFILRFEDTDPRTKRPLLDPDRGIDAYEMIREDLRWLGLRWSEEYIQSERLEIYYSYAKKLIELGGAYVCTCPAEKWREYRDRGMACPCRNRMIEENLELWDRLVNGQPVIPGKNRLDEGDAVLRVKTDLSHPDPSVRDWVAFRIVDPEKYPHPYLLYRYGRNKALRYWMWPTYNFACAIDDHLMGVTHILRAQEHSINTVKQMYIYKYMGWKYPEAIHFGRLKLEGTVLSKSRIREGIERGLFTGFDDPRLPTLAGLRRRGILPETIWRIILDVGIKPTDASISLENLFSINKKILDPQVDRYMFVPDPVKLVIEDVPSELEAVLKRHPTRTERGARVLKLRPENSELTLYISRSDLELMKVGLIVRLMELCNVTVLEVSRDIIRARYHSKDVSEVKKFEPPIIQWVHPAYSVEVSVIVPEGMNLKTVRGLAEDSVRQLEVGARIQFVRFGFVKLDERTPSELRFIYIHP
ncbi:MAG: glutamate--tRNA ligase [Thermoprotei archaeon]|nr:MAG: glutamate--tRNA ligase [Thermoprotei archaeon]